MEKRKIAEGVKNQPYFKAAVSLVPEQDDGTREMGELYPFLICGGKNTERYYFTHINDKTNYKFNIRPRYFGDESNYTETFPKRIKEILSANNDVKIYCVFDWDTIYGDEIKLKKHETFEEQFQTEISNGIVVICPSMPSIEYWFLLHFVNDTNLLKSYGKVAEVLAPHMKSCFPDPTKPLKKLLKKEKYLKDATWVENLCTGGKLNKAIERAEKNIKDAINSGNLMSQSYSYVYKVFMKQ